MKIHSNFNEYFGDKMGISLYRLLIQYMKDYNMELRILDEPLMTVGLGVAFAKDDTRGICQKLEQTLADMKEDGTAAKIIGKYLDDPEKYLEVDKIGEE